MAAADRVEISVRYHQVPPGGYPFYDWSVTVDGIRAKGMRDSQWAALRAARRRVRKIQRLRSKLDVPSLIEVAARPLPVEDTQ